MVKLPSSTFGYLLHGATDEAIIEAGTSVGKDVPRTYILAKWGEITIANCLEYLKTMSTHAKLYEFSEVTHNGKVSVTMSHSFGAKGNLFLQSYIQAIFSHLGKSPKFSPGENAVVFELQ